MVDEDENNTGSRRSRFFGGRRRKLNAPPTDTLPPVEEATAADGDETVTDTPPQWVHSWDASLRDSNEETQSTQVPDTVAETAETTHQEAALAFGIARSSTALLFQAPPVLPHFDQGLLPGENEAFETTVTKRHRKRERDSSGDSFRRDSATVTEPQKVKGSTRLEAKRQRRRDGRDTGRRRGVVTEAEFLARREAVDRHMIVRSKNDRIQIGVLEDGVLVEHYVAKAQEASLIGNVYLGKVQNVLPSMEAAFVDIGRGRNAVLYSGEVDWDAAQTAENNQPRRIENALKAGDKVLVQVTKDPVGHKGARLSSQVSLPGRFLVYIPNGSTNGISRKLPDNERTRLKKILKDTLPEKSGVIVRTAAEGASEEQLTFDVSRLKTQWEEISRTAETALAPALLHNEPDLLVKIIRDVFNEDFQKLVVQGDEAHETIERYLSQVAPDLVERIETFEGEDAFDSFRITEQIDKALERKVWLPSGGSLVIDRTEAMTVIDVNTGKFVGSGGNLEETVTKNNLEAAEEIVRQLRLRDVGGMIVVDFIDMVLESNRDLVLRRLVECLSRDRTKHQVAEVTSLGLVQMTRKKLGLGLLETFGELCEVCAGRGMVVHHDPAVKHRATQSEHSTDRRRGRTSNGTSTETTHEGTHQITDEAKSGLARIAASTIHGTDNSDGEGSAISKSRRNKSRPAPVDKRAGETAKTDSTRDGDNTAGTESTSHTSNFSNKNSVARDGRVSDNATGSDAPADTAPPGPTMSAPAVLITPAEGTSGSILGAVSHDTDATVEQDINARAARSSSRRSRGRRASTAVITPAVESTMSDVASTTHNTVMTSVVPVISTAENTPLEGAAETNEAGNETRKETASEVASV